jgi:diguanylate cyclase (GGDEF)-like protein/PAS domain S-box-containing protein
MKLSVRRFQILMIAAFALGNLMAVALAGYFLLQSKAQYEQQGVVQSQNIALAIEQTVSNTLRRLDQTIVAVAGELERQLAVGAIDAGATEAFLARQMHHVPDVAGIRISDADGLLIAGSNVDLSERSSVADRPYFLFLRDHADAGLHVSDPVQGRIMKKWLITLARRYQNPDGSFAGIVLIPIPLDTFDTLFSQFEVGQKGVVMLRKNDAGLVTRYPPVARSDANLPGNKLISGQLRAIIESGAAAGTYSSTAPSDGIERITTVRRVDGAPMVVSVGVARLSYLEAWRVQVWQTALLLAGFALFSVASTILLLNMFKRAMRESARNRLFLQGASDGIHLLDERGNVVEANQQFCDMLGYRREQVIGMNVTQWDAQWSPEVLLEEVLPHHLRLDAPLNFETLHRRRDGSIFDVSISAIAFDFDGERLIYAASRDISAQKRQQQALQDSSARLRESETRLHAIIEADPECVQVLALDGSVLQMNSAGLAMIEAERGETLVGLDFCALLTPAYRPAFAELSEQVCQGHAGKLEFEIVGLKGTRRWLETHAVPLRDDAGRITGQLAISRDVSERRRAEEGLRRAAAVFQSTREGIVFADLDGVILSVNPAFSAITGYSEAEAVGQKNSFRKSTHHAPEFYTALWQALRQVGHWQGEIWNRRKDGEIYPEWLTISTVYDERGRPTNYVGVFTDITHVKQSEARLQHLAHHDVLTGLPNRLLLLSRIEHAVQRALRTGGLGAVLFIDLDHFKHVNDSLGHPAGDEVLRIVAQRFKSRLRSLDTLARLGGDEFIILLEDIVAPADAAAVAQTLIEQLRAPCELSCGQAVYLGCSVGISVYPDDSSDHHQLIKYADTALYRAKDNGRGTYHFYAEALGAQAHARLVLESNLQRALAEEQFVLHYQPRLDLHSERVLGVQALLRWQVPGAALMLPEQFLGLAEESGLSMALGNWALRHACQQAAAWRRAGREVASVALRLTLRQLRAPTLAQEVAAILVEHPLPRGSIELEIAESAALQMGDEVRANLAALKGLGVRLCIADFGSGYASQASLQRLPLDTLKIDPALVRALPDTDAGVVAAIVALAHNLQLTVAAEGVDTAAQRDLLARLGCQQGQGLLYGAAMPVAALEQWLEQAGVAI